MNDNLVNTVYGAGSKSSNKYYYISRYNWYLVSQYYSDEQAKKAIVVPTWERHFSSVDCSLTNITTMGYVFR